MLACSIFSTSRKDCDCDVTRASIGSSGDVSSLLFHGTQTAVNGRAVQLQPLSGQRPERTLLLVPGPDDLVHHLHSDAEQGADVVLPAPVPVELTCQHTWLSVRGEGQEAIVPVMATRLEAARHALGPQRFEGGGQQSFLLGIHRALLGTCGTRPGVGPRGASGDLGSGWRRGRRQSEAKRPAAT